MKADRTLCAALCLWGLAWGPLGAAAWASEPKSTYWQHDPAEPGEWFDATNWSAGLPGPGTWTYIDNGGTAVIHALTILGGPDDWINGEAAASMLYVGDGKGGAVEQASGTLKVTSDIYLNRYGQAWASYNLLGGWVFADNVYIGAAAVWDGTMEPVRPCGGRFRQTGGVCVIGGDSAASGWLHVGAWLAQPIPLGSGSEPQAGLPAAGGDDAPYWPGALYELAGGELSTAATSVGSGGTGKFVQTGGTSRVGGGLLVSGSGWGCGSPGSRGTCTEGTYVLEGGRLSAGSVRVGHTGRGWFYQNGGTARIDKTLQVGADWSWWIVDCIIPADGHYVLNDGLLQTGTTEVGVGGVGEFVQTGGAHEIAGLLRVGGHPSWPLPFGQAAADPAPSGAPEPADLWPDPGPPRGAYAMQGGTLSAARMEIGPGYWAWPWDGTGYDYTVAVLPSANFAQTGGDVKVKGEVQVRSGRYDLSAGTLTAGSLLLTGPFPYNTGQFRQTGGTCTVTGGLEVGTEPWPVYLPDWAVEPRLDPAGNADADPAWWKGAQYTLAGGDLFTGYVHVGYQGPGRFVQSAGTHTIAGSLYVGGGRYYILDTTSSPDPAVPEPYPWRCEQGTYEISGGALAAGSVHVGQWGRGRFVQSGGEVSVTGCLQVGGNWWWWPRPIWDSDAPEAAMTSVLPPDDSRPGQGTYVLSAGILKTRQTEVGLGGWGQFVQTGGRHLVGETLRIGGDPYWLPTLNAAEGDATIIWPPCPWPCSGSYTLSGGELSAGRVEIRSPYWHWYGNPVICGVETDGSVWPEPGERLLWPPATFRQTAGDVKVARDFSVRGGRCEISGGTLTALELFLSNWCAWDASRFDQSGGTVEVRGLHIGAPTDLEVTLRDDGTPMAIMPYPSGGAVYAIRDGSLSAGRIAVTSSLPWERRPILFESAAQTFLPPEKWLDLVAWSPAAFCQSGGDVKVAGGLTVSSGRADVSGGTLSVQDIDLSSFRSAAASWLRVCGGNVEVRGSLHVGAQYWINVGPPPETGGAIGPIMPSPSGPAICLLSAGTLTAESVEVAGFGKAMLCQTGGELEVGRSLEVVGTNAVCGLYGGELTTPVLRVGRGAYASSSNAAGARLHLGGREAHVTVTESLIFGGDGHFSAVAGSSIQMKGADLENYSRDPVALLGLDSLRLVFTIGTEDDLDWETYEVAGKDLGFVRHGWWENFQLHTLQVGGEDVGELKLVDEFDNQPDYDREALYVRYLRIGPGSKLDLNGLNLYYLDGCIDDDAIIFGGRTERIPDPAWALPCDLDFDGCVSRGDFEKLRVAFGQPDVTAADGDLDGDGDVDAFDYIILKRNVGRAAPDDPAGVPEPVALLLLALAAPALLARRRRS